MCHEMCEWLIGIFPKSESLVIKHWKTEKAQSGCLCNTCIPNLPFTINSTMEMENTYLDIFQSGFQPHHNTETEIFSVRAKRINDCAPHAACSAWHQICPAVDGLCWTIGEVICDGGDRGILACITVWFSSLPFLISKGQQHFQPKQQRHCHQNINSACGLLLFHVIWFRYFHSIIVALIKSKIQSYISSFFVCSTTFHFRWASFGRISSSLALVLPKPYILAG